MKAECTVMDDQRATKRRRLSSDDEGSQSYDIALKSVLSHEIDLEIALRQRLADMVEARINWAFLLLVALSGGDHGVSRNSGLFREAALDALNAIDLPSSLMANRDISILLAQFALSSGNIRTYSLNALKSPLQINAIKNNGRPSVARNSPFSNGKLLYVRNTGTYSETVAKMVCPDCSRSDFTTVQGLLNHCRLRHDREYGSHDECMQHCAVIVSGDERDWVTLQGTELKGVSLPSLRRLFEIAVGDGKSNVRVWDRSAEKGLGLAKEEETVSTLLSRTLGHHKDSPALAPFLGKVPKRRRINTYSEDQLIDVGDESHQGSSDAPRSWRMQFCERNGARPELDLVWEPNDGGEAKVPASVVAASASDNGANTYTDSSSTRFHIIARVVVSDWSAWIPSGRRPKSTESHTHRWMVSVGSPSYSLHVSTFLSSMTVTCITQPNPTTINFPLIVHDPPFSVSGTTDKPFLVRVTLSWAGGINMPLEVEHWVELDTTKAVHPVLGDEQLLDVELDRSTELLPIRNTYKIHHWDTVESLSGEMVPMSTAPESDDHSDVESILKSLVPRIPATMQDLKGRAASKLPYRLVACPTHLLQLTPGRRKAIEWARARALKQEYHNLVTSSALSSNAIILRTADIFRWMEDHRLFPRPDIEGNLIKSYVGSSSVPFKGSCPVCGVPFIHHDPVTREEATGPHYVCSITIRSTSRISVQDISSLLKGRFLSSPQSSQHHEDPSFYILSQHSARTFGFTAHELVFAADPTLVSATGALLQSQHLNNLTKLPVSKTGVTAFPIAGLGDSSDDVAESLSIPALLSLLTSSLVKVLIKRGLRVAEQEWVGLRRRYKSLGPLTLTPSHVIEGVREISRCETAEGVMVGSALWHAVAPLHISVAIADS